MNASYSTAPVWRDLADLHAEWVNSRPLDQSIAFSIFLKHLSDAFQVGLCEVKVSSESSALTAGDECVVGEWHLTGDLNVLRSALQATMVDVHTVSLSGEAA